MLTEILEQQRRSLARYFTDLDLAEVERALEACLNTEGLIVFTGVGKSGIIAEKIAATLISTGTRAIYLPSTNFLHGDMGILSEKDLFVVMSRSGETEELLTLIPFAKRRGTRVMAVVCNRVSRLVKQADVSVVLPFDKELCPFDLAPTTSTMVQLLFGDLLTVALMRKKNFDLAQYSLNHPAGAIGRKANVRVADVMHKEEALPLVALDLLLKDVLLVLSEKRMGMVLVTDAQKHLKGVFTDGDLRRALQSEGESVLERPISALMTHAALVTEPQVLAFEALRLMQKDPKKFVMVLPVLDGKKIVGILRMHDIVQSGIA